MADQHEDLKVGETVYWVRWDRTPSGFRGKTVLYSRVEILALKQNTVQIDKRLFVPYGSIQKLDTFKTLDVTDQEGGRLTVISDSIKLRTSGGGDYHVEGVDFNSGYTVSLFRASGKGAVTACRSYIYTSKPEQREIEAREKEETRLREEESKREEKLREKAREEKYALDRIKSQEIFQSYLNREGSDPLSNLRKAFLATSPKNILLEAENCIAAGIDADTVMREGMVTGYLRAFRWLHEQLQDNLVFFPEIVVYNRQVIHEDIAGFKSRFKPKPLNGSPRSPILLFSTLASYKPSKCYEGICNILEIPVVQTIDEYNVQKIERLIDENGIETIVCFLVKNGQLNVNRSNDLNFILIERMRHRTDVRILVDSEFTDDPFPCLQGLNASHITTCHSLFEVLSHFNTDGIDRVMMDQYPL